MTEKPRTLYKTKIIVNFDTEEPLTKDEIEKIIDNITYNLHVVENLIESSIPAEKDFDPNYAEIDTHEWNDKDIREYDKNMEYSKKNMKKR